MLDDLKYIHTKDGADALGFAAKQPDQLLASFDCEALRGPFENAVFAGMGGSALWAMISQSWPGYCVPLEVWRRYDGPAYISNKTLFIASSYSGNTEETISAVEAAQKAGATIVVVARGGRLIEMAEANGYPYIQLPQTEQPRLGTFSGYKTLITIMNQANLIKTKQLEKTIADTAKGLKKVVSQWAPDVPTAKNPAKQLALEIAGTSPVIYAGTRMYPAAYKWKLAFNEAAKNVAWAGELPEFSHNEFTGWTSHPVDKPYSIIDLRSSYEHPRTTKRFELSERLLSGKRPHPHTVHAQGNSELEHMLYVCLFGDFVGIYVGLLNGVDPTKLELVDTMKDMLK